MLAIYSDESARHSPRLQRSFAPLRCSRPRRLGKIRHLVVRSAQSPASAQEIMKINEGGCLCSAIRFRISGEPIFSSICHCASCRRASAAPTVAWVTFDRGQVEILSGRPRVYRSSQGVIRQFCGTCGSQLLYENVASPATIDITTASLDNPNLFPPSLETWLEHRLPWQSADQARTQYPRSTL
jgi:hypothetical protein